MWATGDGHLLGDPGAGVKVRARVFVSLALLENSTKPQGRKMRSLTKAVPTEKAAVRQAMPRGRRGRRRRRLRRRQGRAAGARLRSLTRGSAAAPRAGSGSPGCWGSGPAPRWPRP